MIYLLLFSIYYLNLFFLNTKKLIFLFYYNYENTLLQNLFLCKSHYYETTNMKHTNVKQILFFFFLNYETHYCNTKFRFLITKHKQNLIFLLQKHTIVTQNFVYLLRNNTILYLFFFLIIFIILTKTNYCKAKFHFPNTEHTIIKQQLVFILRSRILQNIFFKRKTYLLFYKRNKID